MHRLYRFFNTPFRKKLIDWLSPACTFLTISNAFMLSYYALASMHFHFYNRQFKKGMNEGSHDAIWQDRYRLSPDFTPDQPNTSEAYFHGILTGLLLSTTVFGLAKTLYYTKENPKKNDFVYPLLSSCVCLVFVISFSAHSLKHGLPGNSPYDQGYYYGYQSSCLPDDPHCIGTIDNPQDYQIRISHTILVAILAALFVLNLALTIIGNLVKGFLNNEESERLLPPRQPVITI